MSPLALSWNSSSGLSSKGDDTLEDEVLGTWFNPGNCSLACHHHCPQYPPLLHSPLPQGASWQPSAKLRVKFCLALLTPPGLVEPAFLSHMGLPSGLQQGRTWVGPEMRTTQLLRHCSPKAGCC